MPEALAGEGAVREAARRFNFHVMAKPRGPVCNLDCEYCYYLEKERLYPGSDFRMSDELLEVYIRKYIAAQDESEVTFAWQGGEPTLMGLEFFQKAVRLQEAYREPGMQITNALQTNGTQLTPEWCDFFREHNFLIGISVDGPAELHDRFRVSKGGRPTHAAVMRGLELLRKHRVEYNILTTVHAANVRHPEAVYRYLRDELGSDYLQFIPIVVPKSGGGVTDFSVSGEAYGRFLIGVFDQWLQADVGRLSVQIFETSLASWMGLRPGLCVFEETCGTALAMEHNGDLFSCDHFVEPEFKIGNAANDDLRALVSSPRQTAFGNAKRDSLPRFCRECDVRFACNGGCPKNRIAHTPDGEPGLNHLCAGYKLYFHRINEPMQVIAGGIQQGQPMPAIQQRLHLYWQNMTANAKRAGRNDPCPCGSGLKVKKCHG